MVFLEYTIHEIKTAFIFNLQIPTAHAQKRLEWNSQASESVFLDSQVSYYDFTCHLEIILVV